MKTLEALVATFGGRLLGPADLTIHRLAALDTATPEGTLAFLIDARFLTRARLFKGTCVATREPIEGAEARAQWIHPNPRALRRRLSQQLRAFPQLDSVPGIHPSAVIDATASVSERARIEAGVVIGADVIIEEGVVVHANAVIDLGARLQSNARVHACAYVGPGVVVGQESRVGVGVILGEPGFGFEAGLGGSMELIEHIGSVIVGDRVVIGSGSCIDAGTLEPTVVGDDTRIDNLVHIAHNVRIGQRCWLLGQVGIAGSTIIEDDVVVAGQAGVAGHLKIGKGTQIAGRAGVVRDSAPGSKLGGFPAVDMTQWRRMTVVNRKLQERLTQIEERLAQLEARPPSKR